MTTQMTIQKTTQQTTKVDNPDYTDNTDEKSYDNPDDGP
jgi:hypothetical protein